MRAENETAAFVQRCALREVEEVSASAVVYRIAGELCRYHKPPRVVACCDEVSAYEAAPDGSG